ncbi:MAG TPA: helix-turn-helix transcriptional regulator [Polyangiaceae bacterium]|nr:helix-turn-helix transcriptional regulator [Polyangiaceae bacterium]
MKIPRKKQPAGSKPRLSGVERASRTAEGIELDTSESELHALLGRHVREARARRFMTRKALARDSGISLAYLARVEAGTGNISLGLLQRLALALNLPIEGLLTSEATANPDFTLIIEFLKRQAPERLARIRRQLFDGEADGQRIALIGIRGVGKSTLAPMLADRLGIPFVELNREIEAEANLAVGEIFTLFGQRGYRELERACLERVIAKYPNVVLATGGGLVAESGTYELLLSSFFTVWLQARPRVMFERVLAQHDARIASANLRDEAIENIGRTLEARRPLYELAHASLDTSGKSLEQIVPALLALLPGAGKPKPRVVTG